MAKQGSFAGSGFEKYSRMTRRERFLNEMEQAVPWQALIGVIEPYYPKEPGQKGGRPPRGLEVMLRIHLLQHWFTLSDPGVEDALYESPVLRKFVGIDLGREPVPDETTVMRFRHLLEEHDLGRALFETINGELRARGLLLQKGTIVDATIINAPSSTKNATGERDPEMHQTKKGEQWCVSRTQASNLWCCTEDGRRPPEVGLQEQASNRPGAAALKRRGGERPRKSRPLRMAGVY
jgi:transposase, IS5 family